MFSQSIHKSSEILKPFGMDLLDILLNGDDELLNKHMGTCFVAMGVRKIYYMDNESVFRLREISKCYTLSLFTGCSY